MIRRVLNITRPIRIKNIVPRDDLERFIGCAGICVVCLGTAVKGGEAKPDRPDSQKTQDTRLPFWVFEPESGWTQPFQGSVFYPRATQGSSPGEQPWAKCWNPFGILAMNCEAEWGIIRRDTGTPGFTVDAQLRKELAATGHL
jgi:hypothetical protein